MVYALWWPVLFGARALFDQTGAEKSGSLIYPSLIYVGMVEM
jgi:hypothetical protein